MKLVLSEVFMFLNHCFC